jgi:hypothetical protein
MFDDTRLRTLTKLTGEVHSKAPKDDGMLILSLTALEPFKDNAVAATKITKMSFKVGFEAAGCAVPARRCEPGH